MNESVFVDTGAWFALTDPSDALRPLAQRWFLQIESDKRGWVTTSAVITEVLDGFASHRMKYMARQFSLQLPKIPRLEIVHVDEELFGRAWDFYEARSDKDWSLTDCISFVVMQERGMSDSLAHDHHFEQAGFRALLRETE